MTSLLVFSLINFWQWHQKHFLLAQILLASKPSWQFTLKLFLGLQHPQQTRYSNIVYIIPFPYIYTNIYTKKEIMSIHEFPIHLRLKYVDGLVYYNLQKSILQIVLFEFRLKYLLITFFYLYVLFWSQQPWMYFIHMVMYPIHCMTYLT